MFQLRTYAALTAVLFASSAAFAELGGTCDPEPVMQTGDFNGNGYIDSGDIEMISAYIEEGDYAAFFDMNTDGVLNGADVSIVAKQLGEQATVRDVQMATLWATTEPYRNIYVAYGAGYVPFTPDLRGHGIHFANFDLINSWGSRRFQAGAPEGLNYTAEGILPTDSTEACRTLGTITSAPASAAPAALSLALISAWTRPPVSPSVDSSGLRSSTCSTSGCSNSTHAAPLPE
jgi:hypothetical protein